MERIGLVGLNWRLGGPETLARFTLPLDGREDAVRALADELGVAELVYLATCNRVELLYAVADGLEAQPEHRALRARAFRALTGSAPAEGEAERTFRAWFGEGAIEHLFCVGAGLDSARVGESDVSHQVREALDVARAAGVIGPRLELVTDAALDVARRVHRETRVGSGRESLAEIALDHVRARLAETPGAVGLVGVGAMTERCASALAAEGTPLVWANRTVARAADAVAASGARAAVIGLDRLRAEPPAVEALVLSTGAPDAVLRRADLERLAARSSSGRPPLVVDLAVPPDVDPADAASVGLPRIGMEEVLDAAESTRRERLLEAADARALVDESLAGLRRRLVDQTFAPVFSAIQRRYRDTAREGVERLLARELSGLGQDEAVAVRRWAETLAARFAHLPTAGLREVAVVSGEPAVRAFFSRGDARLAEHLSRAEAEARMHAPRPADEDDA